MPKSKMIVLIIVSISVLIIVSISVLMLTFYFRYKGLIDQIDRNGAFQYKVYNSPNKINKITLFAHIKGVFDYYTYIYIINGKYTKDQIPTNNQYIKFPYDTGVNINWRDDYFCNIIADKQPEINNLENTTYEINLQIDKKEIRSLEKEGRVIRYFIEPVK